MKGVAFDEQLALNRLAYGRLREQIRTATPGQYAAIAQGRLIALRETFDEAVDEEERLQPAPEHFLVFPVDEEPAFDVIDDFRQRL